MIITLTRAQYNTSLSEDRKRLKQYIYNLRCAKKNELLDSIGKQIEQERCVDDGVLEIYGVLKKTKPSISEFATRYFKASAQDKKRADNQYSFIKGKFFRLPFAEDSASIIYALLDKYLYERKRNSRNSEVCLSLRRVIHKFIPGAIRKSDVYLEAILIKQEMKSKNYYGDNLSDNSDSDEEEKFKHVPSQQKDLILEQAKKYIQKAKGHLYINRIKNEHEEPPANDFKKRPVICRDKDFDRRQVKSDLKKVNEKLRETGYLTPDFLASLKTQFVVAQYRGIHYDTAKWDAKARREHRIIDEINKPQYSSAVFESCNLKSYHHYLEKISTDKDFYQELNKKSIEVFTKLLHMQHSTAVSYDNFAYVSLFHLMQYWYSSNYASFPTKLEYELNKEDSLFKKFLVNSSRPLVSTGDIPYHALKYAYGLKLYKDFKHQRLRPRWRIDGTIERPYSGKVYVSLHPLSDYTELKPSHVTSMYNKGTLKLNNLISSERETSFLGYIPKDRVVYQYKAKYPSLRGDYKNIYAHKYGMSQDLYQTLQSKFQQHPPHSEKRRNIKRILGEYLCSYHEVRLIETARLKAKENSKVLIYRDQNGMFSTYHPSTPHTANKKTRSHIMDKRKIYTALSPNKTKIITPLSDEQISKRLEEILPGDDNAELRKNEILRFSTNKSPTKNINTTVKPAKTLVR